MIGIEEVKEEEEMLQVHTASSKQHAQHSSNKAYEGDNVKLSSAQASADLMSYFDAH